MLGRLGKDRPKIIYDNGVWAGVSFDSHPCRRLTVQKSAFGSLVSRKKEVKIKIFPDFLL